MARSGANVPRFITSRPAQRGLGFSGIVSIGDQLDVDIADLLDYFALDSKTHAILLYVEAITDARKFMSAARAAARIKPVVVVKSGRMAQGAKAAATHTGYFSLFRFEKSLFLEIFSLLLCVGNFTRYRCGTEVSCYAIRS